MDTESTPIKRQLLDVEDSPLEVPANYLHNLSSNSRTVSGGQSQNTQDYNQKMKTLSCAIYVGSDEFEVEDNEEEAALEVSNHQDHEKSEADLEVFQTVYEHPQQRNVPSKEEDLPLYEEIKVDHQLSDQQGKRGALNMQDEKQSSEENNQVMTASINSYRESMQFFFPSLMSQSLNEQDSGQELRVIDQGNVAQEQTVELQLSERKSSDRDLYPQVEDNLSSAAVMQIVQVNEIPVKQEIKPLQIKQQQNLIPPKPIRQIPLSKLSFSEVKLEKFSMRKPKNISIKIIGYQKQYFLKVQTQIYQIQVQIQKRTYAIKRRFSDFSTLQTLIRQEFAGYIIYPFPENSFQFFKKLQFSKGNEQQRVFLIQKRLFELQSYLNFLLSHQEISTSRIMAAFIQEVLAKFQQSFANLQSMKVLQERQIQYGAIEKKLSSIKKMVSSRFSFFGYLPAVQESAEEEYKFKDLKERTSKNNELFASIRLQVETSIQKLSDFSLKVQKLATLYKENSEISMIDSNIDSVLKLSSKLTSSSTFYQRYSTWLSDNILYHLRYYGALLRTVQSLLGYRADLMQRISNLQIEHLGIGFKIEEKIILFDQRFIGDWTTTFYEFQHNLQTLQRRNCSEWRKHCSYMIKIWQ